MKFIRFALYSGLLFAASTCFAQMRTSTDSSLINIGITWCDNRLVIFDPFAGTAASTKVVLPGTGNCFRGLAFDSDHNRLYALAQVTFALYSINPASGVVKDLGQLNLSGAGDFSGLSVDIGGLAYRPDHGLYTTVTAFDVFGTPRIAKIVQIDPKTRQVTPVAMLPDGYAGSLVWDSGSQSFLAYTTPYCGSWDSPCKTSMFRFNPSTGQLSTLFELPYHVVLGLTPSTRHTGKYISWINYTSHFYAEVDINTGNVVSLANSDAVRVSSDAMMTMNSKRFHAGH